MKVLTTIDLLALPSLETPPAGHVGFGAKSDGLYQKVGTVETKLAIDGHTHTIAQITGLQGALDSKATHSDISTAVNNLEIGGRNLLLNSDFSSGRESWDGQFSISGEGAILESVAGREDLIQNTTVIPRGDYIFQVWYEVLEGDPPYLYLSGGSDATFDNAYFIDVNEGYAYVGITIRSDSRMPALRYAAGVPVGHLEGKTLIKRVKLEKGNKATDWTPAPEDQVSDWSVTDVNSFAFIKNKPTLLSQFTDNIGVATHIANKANPHNVTTAQIGAVDLTTNQTIGGVKTFTGNVTAPTFIGALTGNASSATKLQTARTIAGVSFNGTANIAIPFANLSSKPTTLAGYGITDGVQINSNNWANFRYANFSIDDKDVVENVTGSLKLDGWYNISIGAEKVYGTRLTINGQSAHDKTQLYFNGQNGSIQYRKSWWNNTPWTELRTIWDSNNLTNLNQLTTRNFSDLQNKPTTLSGYGITDGALKSLTLTAGNGLTGGGTLEANRTFALGTPSTLTSASTNAVTSTSHTHAITTTTVGAANTIVATDASGGVRGNIIRIGANWTLELSGTELVFKYNGVIKQRMLSNGSIVATGELTAYVAAT